MSTTTGRLTLHFNTPVSDDDLVLLRTLGDAAQVTLGVPDDRMTATFFGKDWLLTTLADWIYGRQWETEAAAKDVEG